MYDDDDDDVRNLPKACSILILLLFKWIMWIIWILHVILLSCSTNVQLFSNLPDKMKLVQETL